ncbi:MAG: bifunctional alpha,alpha-trehalose-phosphate synthase (UDP-forming)/trehalose-phosphatase [Nitrospinae bacterium]|nr:bifunctional alpha,alpha-trehalose-phosphate synthase (UDP-forming)/trehalose-phosphatase [Nitrospinota bacterium]
MLGLTGARPKTETSRLIIVSNRLPVSVEYRRDGYTYSPSAGGLATALGSIYKQYKSAWVGWPGISSEKARKGMGQIERALEHEHSCHPVWLSRDDVDDYYHGFSNKTVWPLFHYFPKMTTYNRSHWETYKRVNALFRDAVLRVAKDGDMIWIQDYHLMLLPEMLRKEIPNASIGFFLHIPFPTFEVFRLLPWREEILMGLLGSDLVGFHTYDYTLYFLRSVHRLLGMESHLGVITLPTRTVKADTFPIGIDFDRFSQASSDPAVIGEMEGFRASLGGRKMILSIDRLDYTKGITQRLKALDSFFTRYPKWREKVTNVAIAAPSRDQVDQYRYLKKEVDELVGDINGRHGAIGWAPIQYLYRTMSFQSICALYNLADVALITPVRDGMNLVAKEYLACKNSLDGALILSEMTGAAKELGEAVIVNPNDIESMADSIAMALEMPEEERKERMRAMRRRVQRYNAARWGDDFISRLQSVKKAQEEMGAKLVSWRTKAEIKSIYKNSAQRLFLLDYDGTLTGFYPNPADARPGDGLRLILTRLAANPKNSVVIISGRDRAVMDNWFSDINIDLISEHGVALKEAGEWKVTEQVSTAWKDDIRQILEFYADRTPGAFVEEKEFSLVWHYRKSDPELGALRANELKDNLKAFIANLGLQVQEGSKVIDVRNAGVNKGKAALGYTARTAHDFILAVGDDWTDEDMFRSLPENAITIKVGLPPTAAKYNLESPENVVSFLDELSLVVS